MKHQVGICAQTYFLSAEMCRTSNRITNREERSQVDMSIRESRGRGGEREPWEKEVEMSGRGREERRRGHENEMTQSSGGLASVHMYTRTTPSHS